MDAAAVRGLARTAREFARRHVVPMVAEEGRDGNLELLPAVLEEAEAVGVMASADRDAPGHEYGVWGVACLEDGPVGSLAILEEVARACAGVACCLHSAGLGALEVAGSSCEARRVGVALEGDQWHLMLAERVGVPAAASATGQGEHGRAPYVAKSIACVVPGWSACVVYHLGSDTWHRTCVRRESDGVEVSPVGRRMGLSAAEVVELSFTQGALAAGDRLELRSPSAFFRRHLLGLSAVAVGNARGAVNAARAYAEHRYQGGDQIETHSAVQILIGDAGSRVAASAALLHQTAADDDEGEAAVLRAVTAKLRTTVDCCQAITDCLQVFGGYGYMEDYGLEKRLRDAMTLKAMSIRPDALRQMLALADVGGGR